MAVRPGRTGRWAVEFEQGGVRVHKRLPAGTTKAQAEEWERQERRRIFDQEILGKRPPLLISDAIDLWLKENERKNQKQAKGEAKQWEPFVHGRYLKDVAQVAAEAKAAWKKPAVPTGKVKPIVPTQATVNRRLAMMKAVCKHAYRRELVPENWSARIVVPAERNRKEIYLTVEQVKSLSRMAASPTIAHAILVLAYCGLRSAELLALTQASLQGDTLAVVGKRGKARQVPLPLGAKRSVGRLSLPLSLSYWQLRDGFDEARKKAGLPKGVTLHTLRHTTASWLINAGVDLYTVGKILGHSSPLTTARYAHLADASLKKAMRKLR